MEDFVRKAIEEYLSECSVNVDVSEYWESSGGYFRVSVTINAPDGKELVPNCQPGYMLIPFD